MIVKKIQLSLTEEMIDKVEELKSELSFSSNSMVWYAALSQLYRSTFPAYARAGMRAPEQKVKEKIREKEVKAEFELAAKREVVKQLGGKIVKAEGGAEIANYFTYSGRKRYEQETPLHLITEDLLMSQYSPDRPTVERLHKDKKTDW